jgi:diguanylate cyclase (GGDEF)-like protein
MDVRLRKARAIAMAFLGAALILAGPWVGWWPILILVGLIVAWRLVQGVTDRSDKPEWPIAFAWLVSVAGIAGGVLFTGGAQSPAKSWLLVPVIALPARFNRRGLYAGIAISLLTLAAVTIAADPHDVAKAPQLFIFPAALIAAAAAMSMALRNAEIEHRNESVIDQLTGMLNRKALESRTVELEMQSRVSGQPIGLIVCDIDHFKRVNDEHGHTMGDAVLKDVAYRIRKELRAYDLAYRLGGEEFVVLLPGATRQGAGELAERLRRAVEGEAVEQIPVTASFGVAASGREGLAFRTLFEAADEALYRSKAAGRNRVCMAADGASEPSLA